MSSPLSSASVRKADVIRQAVAEFGIIAVHVKGKDKDEN